MIKWKLTGKTAGPEGTTITYTGEGTDFTIESRMRHIPHANGSGTWDHTTYWLFHKGQTVRECHRLSEAKKLAEKLI